MCSSCYTAAQRFRSPGPVGYPVAGIVLALISIATAAALRAVMPGS